MFDNLTLDDEKIVEKYFIAKYVDLNLKGRSLDTKRGFSKYLSNEFLFLKNTYNPQILANIQLQEITRNCFELFIVKNPNLFDESEYSETMVEMYKKYSNEVWKDLWADVKTNFDGALEIKIKQEVWKSFFKYITFHKERSVMSIKNGQMTFRSDRFKTYFESQMMVYSLALENDNHLSLEAKKVIITYVEKFDDLINRIYKNYLRQLPYSDYEDLVSEQKEKFLNAFRQKEFTLSCSMYTFILRYARNAWKFKRQNNRIVTLDERITVEDYSETLDNNSFFYDQGLYTESIVQKCCQLRSNYQMVLDLNSYQIENELIARYLKTTEGNVRQLKRRAINALKRLMKG